MSAEKDVAAKSLISCGAGDTTPAMHKLKRLVRDLGLKLLRACGSTIIDAETGANLGRAFLFPWKGTIKVIGLETPVRPVFLAQTRLTYWKQELGFTVHPPPDFPRRAQGS